MIQEGIRPSTPAPNPVWTDTSSGITAQHWRGVPLHATRQTGVAGCAAGPGITDHSDSLQSWQPRLALDGRSLREKRRTDVSVATSEKINKYDLSWLDAMARSVVRLLSLALTAKELSSGGSCCMYLPTCLSPKLTCRPIMASLAGEQRTQRYYLPLHFP